jgi:hypothetical protein
MFLLAEATKQSIFDSDELLWIDTYYAGGNDKI